MMMKAASAGCKEWLHNHKNLNFCLPTKIYFKGYVARVQSQVWPYPMLHIFRFTFYTLVFLNSIPANCSSCGCSPLLCVLANVQSVRWMHQKKGSKTEMFNSVYCHINVVKTLSSVVCFSSRSSYMDQNMRFILVTISNRFPR